MDAPANIPPGGREAQIPTGFPQGRPAYTTPQGGTPSVTRAPVTAWRMRRGEREAQRRRSEREGSECDARGARAQHPVPLIGTRTLMSVIECP